MTKFGCIGQNADVLSVVELPIISRSTKVHLPSVLSELIQLSGSKWESCHSSKELGKHLAWVLELEVWDYRRQTNEEQKVASLWDRIFYVVSCHPEPLIDYPSGRDVPGYIRREAGPAYPDSSPAPTRWGGEEQGLTPKVVASCGQ